MLEYLARTAYIIRYIIKDEDLDIKFSGNKINFTIYDCDIETDGNTYFKSKCSEKELFININAVEELFQYVLIQSVKNEGFLKYSTDVIILEELSKNDYNHLKRLSENERFIPIQEVLDEIIFTHGEPKKVSIIIGVAEKFIKKIRNLSRHKILSNAILFGNDEYNKNL